jgi:hypothetical protein
VAIFPRSAVRALVVALLLGAAGCSHTTTVQVQDAQIAVRVKTALVNDAVLGVHAIEVNVSEGIARLSGSVASDAEVQRAVGLTRSVDGVRDVRSDLVIRGPSSGDAATVTGVEQRESAAPERRFGAVDEEATEPRLLALGVSFRQTRPGIRDLGNSVRLGPLFRLGSGDGLGIAIGFGWFSSDVSADATPLGRVRIRPVLGGLSYTVRRERVSASFALLGGIAFNALSQQDEANGPVFALDVHNSLVSRPGVSLLFDVSRRTAFNLSASYVITRPQFSVLEQGRVQTRTLHADAALLSTGVVYKLF